MLDRPAEFGAYVSLELTQGGHFEFRLLFQRDRPAIKPSLHYLPVNAPGSGDGYLGAVMFEEVFGSHPDSVNGLLHDSQRLFTQARGNVTRMPKRKKPGSPKGQLKPLKRVLDPDFHIRFAEMIGDTSEEGMTQLAINLRCARQTLYNCITSGKRLVDPLFLFDAADYFQVNPRWLLKADVDKYSPLIRPRPKIQAAA